jgi:hypothetical protein
MRLFEPAKLKPIVVKTYGRGSLLGLLSLPFAFLMASRGMNGWQESAAGDMEDGAVAMAGRGYGSWPPASTESPCSASPTSR